MSDSTILNFCPTGMIPRKATNENIPISPQEIIEQTHQAWELGITLVHLHARLVNEDPTHKKEIYREIVEGLRKHCPGLILGCSTSGRDVSEFEKRSEVIELKPDMCSLTLSSLNFINSASMNAPDMISKLWDKMITYGVYPELECFDLGMINYGKYLIKKKGIKEKNYWNLIFGNIAGFQPDLHHIATAVKEIPEGDFIGLGGLGKFQLKVNSLAVAGGYGVRIGMEDNIWMDGEQTVKATNISLLKRVHKLLEINEKQLMTSKELGFYNKLGNER